MSVIKTIYLLVILISVNISYAANDGQKQIITKQEEILLELANLGIKEAHYVLAQFYNDRISPHNNFFNKSIHWYIKAAQAGHSKSFYRLGEEGLKYPNNKNKFIGTYIEKEDSESEWRKESLILISVAALLENKYAKSDLVVLPKFRPYSYQEIDIAFEEALLRLKQGTPINCNFFVCKKRKTHLKNRLIRYRNAATYFEQERIRLKCDQLKQCFEAMLNNVESFDQISVNRFLAEEAADNLPKKERNKRLKNNKEEVVLSSSWDELSNIDRNDQRFLAAKKVINHYAKEDRNILKTKLKNLLEKINFHRTSANKIKLSDIMTILSQP
ncbi:MAG: hypothetical protein L3J59_02320 [Methylococcaceae bacterium]|nr:hypothetical protein [Methylococcaceae bacterium]